MELSGDEVAAVGRKIYEAIRKEMEANHWGELVVIDIHSGDYEVGEYKGPRSAWNLPSVCRNGGPTLSPGRNR